MLTEQKIDAFFQNPVIAYAFLWGPVLAVWLSSLFTKRQLFPVRVVAALLFGCAAWILGCLPWLAWTMPNGLAPGVEQATGQARVTSFLDTFWAILILGQVFAVGGVLVCIGGALARDRRR